MARRPQGMDQISKSDLAAIHNIARTALGIAGISEDELRDIQQDLTLRLIQKAHLFRKTVQSWGTFRRTVLTRCLSDIIKLRMQPCCRQDYVCRVSLDEELPESMASDGEDCIVLGDMVTNEGMLADNTEKPEIPGLGLKIDMEIFIATLPKKQQRICKVLKKHNPTDAAKILKMHRVVLYRNINAIKRGMKEAGLNIYI